MIRLERVNVAAPGGALSAERVDEIAVLTLGEGARHNALGRDDWEQLAALVQRLAVDPNVKIIIVTGDGSTFCAGSELRAWTEMTDSQIGETFAALESCFCQFERAGVPVIAAVEGVAAGAGCQLALTADIIIAGSQAKFSMPIARLGINASAAFVERVARRTGIAVAADMFLSGRSLSALECQHAGLVARTVPSGAALTAAKELAITIAQLPAEAVAAVRAVFAARTPSGEAPGGAAPATASPVRLRQAASEFLAGSREQR